MKSAKTQKRLSKWIVNLALLFLVILWTIPTMGIFVSSFRQRQDIATTGWWLVFPHREWKVVKTINPKELNLDPSTTMSRGRCHGHLGTAARGDRDPRRETIDLGREQAHRHHPGPGTGLDGDVGLYA